MPVLEYSLKKDGDTRLSDNFRVKEFACKDGSDKILIDSGLVDICRRLRAYFAQPVVIHSGYRTEQYNGAIGGAKDSYHVKGQAADVKISGIDPIAVALCAQDELGVMGIGLYSYPDAKTGFVHVDTRAKKWRGLQIKSSGGGVSLLTDYFPTLQKGASGNSVTLLQRLLEVNDSGKFDDLTELAVRCFQMSHGLTADGIAGPKTWGTLVKDQ